MKMVAGARLNRAQQRISALRPYAVKTEEMLRSVSRAVVEDVGGDAAEPEHPSAPRAAPEKNVLILVVTSDRGLCGAFNTNINKAAEALWKQQEAAEGKTCSLQPLGRKGRDYLARRGGHDRARRFTRARRRASSSRGTRRRAWLVERYKRGEVDAVYLVYNEFKSAITQKPVVESLASARRSDESEASRDGAAARASSSSRQTRAARAPRADVRRDHDLPRAPREPGRLLRRADDGDGRGDAQRERRDRALTLQYNRARQAAITKELMEIIGGAEALKD